MRIPCVLALIATSVLASGCGGGENSDPMTLTPPRLQKADFGITADGRAVDKYTIRNAQGAEMTVLTYGGIIQSLKMPDRTGAIDDVVMGFDSVAEYEKSSPYFGALIGRVGNRIANGTFTLDGKVFTLAKNDGPNHLHGGVKGWDKAVWQAEPFQDKRGPGLLLTHTSPDGDEGYPGKITAHVRYTLTSENELIVEYHATTDAPTVINLTQHSYFNLAGSKAADILGHELTINADRFTPVDAGLIPTGALAPVDGTPFDFRSPTTIGARIGNSDVQLTRGKGYDHNYVLNRTGDGLQLAASVYEPITGRTLEIRTTEPGLQFYSGNFLDGSFTGKGGRAYPHRSGFCLETQHYPDSPNQPAFPSVVLRKGEDYKTETVFKFGSR
jgi:aldose 1-epimerase